MQKPNLLNFNGFLIVWQMVKCSPLKNIDLNEQEND